MNVIENEEQYKRTEDWYDKFYESANEALDQLVKGELPENVHPLMLKIQVTSCFHQLQQLVAQMVAYQILVLKKKANEIG